MKEGWLNEWMDESEIKPDYEAKTVDQRLELNLLGNRRERPNPPKWAGQKGWPNAGK
jgi:hypothetical protein